MYLSSSNTYYLTWWFSIICRNTISKIYPAMYIENVTELAFDDITPEDPDFASIQGEKSKLISFWLPWLKGFNVCVTNSFMS